jgi:hypothetical protein
MILKSDASMHINILERLCKPSLWMKGYIGYYNIERNTIKHVELQNIIYP